jgi:hypothetical protein
MFSGRPVRPSFAGAGLGGPVAPDVWVLLGVLLTSFSLQFFATTAWLPALLRLTPAVTERGWLWQLVSYPFVGTGQPGFWFVLELLILFLFARDACWRLGRARFWRLLVGVAAVAGAVAMTVQLASPGPEGTPPFVLMQGQRTLVAILVAAFATLNAEATIYLFFVLPMPARWFLGLEVLFAFLAFLGTRDLAGFVGLAVAIGATWWWLSRRRGGGPRRWRKQWEERWLRWRLRRLQRRRGLRVVRGEGGSEGGPWVH